MVCETCGGIDCTCVKCSVCKKRVRRRDSCLRCYQCRSHHFVYNTKDFPHRKCCYMSEIDDATYELNPLRRHLGVEVELEDFGYRLQRYPDGYVALDYTMVHDGSVVGSAMELVTNKMIGDRYMVAMAELIRDIKGGGGKANSSCGYHCHVDAADFGMDEIRRAIVLFKTIQMSLYGSLVDRSRAGSHGMQYSAPLKCDTRLLMAMDTKGEFSNWLHSWLYQATIPSRDSYDDDTLYKQALRDIDAAFKKYKSTKYMNHARRMALNFHSWMMRGTLEFRLKEGTTDPKDLLFWPLWCGWFVELCKQMSNSEVNSIIAIPKYDLLTLAERQVAVGMPKAVQQWVTERVAGL